MEEIKKCEICGEIIERKIEIFGIKAKVRCMCACERKKREEIEKRLKQDEIDRHRCICFSQSNMKTWTFENDDRQNEKLSDAMKNYADNFNDFKKKGKGLLLYGTVGTGKTYLAACIANKLIDDGKRVLMTNFATLTNKLAGMFEGKQEYIDNLNSYTLLIIDDLGAERKSEYMQEMVFNIIDSRYRSGLPMIITTNLNFEQLTSPEEITYSRIYDRIIERCVPIKVEGTSRRRKSLKSSLKEDYLILGL